MSYSKITKVNVYRGADGSWYGARWAGAEYDGCDALECDAGASEAEALAVTVLEWDGADVRRVDNTGAI